MKPFRHFGGTPWTGGLAHRKASTCTGQRNTGKRGHTPMPRAGFKPMIPVFERSKTICALDRAATWTGVMIIIIIIVIIIIA